MKKRRNFTIEQGPHTVRVVWVKGLTDKDNKYGQCFDARHLIELDPDQSESRIKETFVHEIVHMADSQWLNNKLDEDQVKALAAGITQMIAPFLKVP